MIFRSTQQQGNRTLSIPLATKSGRNVSLLTDDFEGGSEKGGGRGLGSFFGALELGKSGRLSKFRHQSFPSVSRASSTSSDSHGVSSPPQKESTNYTLTKLCQSVLSYDRTYCSRRHHIIGYLFRSCASTAPTIDCAPEVCRGQ
jgi:hypothetical protein